MLTTTLKNRLAVLGVSALFIYAISGPVGTSYAPAAGTPAGPPTNSVLVVNTAANPVPVVQQGGTTINGTANVNVANSAASPVLVRSVDSGATQPVQVDISLGINAPDTGGFATVYTVPVGKRLVIEYVSVLVSGANLEDAFFVIANHTTGTHVGHLPLSVQAGGCAVCSDAFFGSALVKAYAEAGYNVDFLMDVNNNTFAATALITMSGYLVNVP